MAKETSAWNKPSAASVHAERLFSLTAVLERERQLS